MQRISNKKRHTINQLAIVEADGKSVRRDNPPPSITAISSISEVLQNLRSGDRIYVDVDDTLLITATKHDTSLLACTEAALPWIIKQVQDNGVQVIGLTARSRQEHDKTLNQLSHHSITLNYILYTTTSVYSNKAGAEVAAKGELILNDLDSLRATNNFPLRVFVFDDLYANHLQIQEAFENAAIENNPRLLLFHYQREQLVDLPHRAHHYQEWCQRYFPRVLDASHYVDTLVLGGISHAVIQHEHHQFVLTTNLQSEKIAIKVLCDSIYAALQISIPAFTVYNTLPISLAEKLQSLVSGVHQVSERRTEITLNEAITSKLIAEMKNYTVISLLLGDNGLIDPTNWRADGNENFYYLSTGENYLFEHSGELNNNSNFITQIFKQSGENGLAFKCLSSFGLTQEMFDHQLDHVFEYKNVIETILHETSAALSLDAGLREQFINAFVHRLDTLTLLYTGKRSLSSRPDALAIPGVTSAGIFTYSRQQGVVQVLLAKRNDTYDYECFGGKSDLEDGDLLTTAIREVSEESSEQIVHSQASLNNSPSHDHIYATGNVFRLYFAEQHVELSKLTDDEHTHYCWVPLHELLACITPQSGSPAPHSTLTLKHTLTNGDLIQLPLFQPFVDILSQHAVYNHLLALSAGKSLSLTHTRSYYHHLTNYANRVTTLTSSAQTKWQIAHSLLSHSNMIREFKGQRPVSVIPHVKTVGAMSQSELHMRITMGERYRESDLAFNIRYMLNLINGEIDRPIAALLQEVDNERLVSAFSNFIEQENANPDNLYLYHGCNAQIAFTYMVYTEIYKILNVDNNGYAFRFNVEPFRQFKSVADFIKLFGDKGQITDTDDSYNDTGMSLNAFMFGSYRYLGDCSPWFFLSNSIIRKIDFELLLKNMLKPLGVADTDITKLMWMMERYAETHGSALYQVEIAAADVDNLAYPSRVFGSVNHYGDVTSLREIINSLRHEYATDPSSLSLKQYVNNFQARLLAYPTHRFSCQKIAFNDVKLNPVNVDVVLACESEITSMLSQILSGVLTSDKSNYPIVNNNSTLFPILRSVRQVNHLPMRDVEYNEADFVKAVLSSDQYMMFYVLQKNRNLLFQKISFKQAVYVRYKDAIEFDNLIPAQIILRYGKLAVGLPVLQSAYGADWWRNVEWFRGIRFEGERRIGDILNSLTLSDRLEFMSNDIIQSTVQGRLSTTFYINFLAEDDRFAYLLSYRPQHPTSAWLFEVISTLPIAQRYHFILKNSDIPFTAAVVGNLLSFVSQDDKFRFATDYKHTIQTFDDLLVILKELPSECVLPFSLLYSHLLSHGDQVANILALLPVAARVDYLSQHQSHITDPVHLLNIFRCLPNTVERLHWLDHYKSTMTLKILMKSFSRYLHLVTPIDCVMFTLYFKSVIQAPADFMRLVSGLSYQSIKDFMLVNRERILDRATPDGAEAASLLIEKQELNATSLSRRCP